MKALEAIVVGAGSRGHDSYASYALRHPDELKIVGVAEPNKARREQLAREHGIEPEACFTDWKEVFSREKFADMAFICTQDRMHVEPAVAAMKRGYHILLEKPIAPTLEECLYLEQEAERYSVSVAVAHVLRYTPFFSGLKRLIDQGAIGKIRGIQHNENVGNIHYSHSFVRGNWHKTAESAPMILAKSCHDMDILLFLADAHCQWIASSGSRGSFSAEHAPEGAPDRCLDGCPHSVMCPYYAPKIYLNGNQNWPVNVLTTDLSSTGIQKALEEGPYGRCVYACDNDMTEHQVVSMKFDNGITASFSMSAFTHDTSRSLKIYGETGEIRGHMEREELEIYDFQTGEISTVRFGASQGPAGHGGGDEGIMRDLIRHLRSPKDVPLKTSLKRAIESHVMAFAAEESMQSGKSLSIEEFKKQAK